MCPAKQVLTALATCTTCDDACTGDLLRGLEDLAFDLEVGAGRVAGGVLEAPWAVLEGINTEANNTRGRLEAWQLLANAANAIPSSLPASLRKPANQAVKEVRPEARPQSGRRSCLCP